MFTSDRKREPLAPPLVFSPADPQPCLPALFLGVDDWVIESCEDVLRNDLVFSTRARPLSPIMKGRQEQIHILNFLNGQELLNLSKATEGGSLIVGFEDLAKNDRLKEGIHPCPEGRYRGVIVTDDWFDVDEDYSELASNLLQALKNMYQSGCSVIFRPTEGLFTAPEIISSIFELSQPWRLVAYTTKQLVASPLGKSILGSSFPSKGVYTKVHCVSAPPEQRLVVQYVDPDEYDSEDDIPEPIPATPLPLYRNNSGGSVCYFGFANSLDVSFGAILLKLIHLDFQGESVHPLSKVSATTESLLDMQPTHVEKGSIQVDQSPRSKYPWPFTIFDDLHSFFDSWKTWFVFGLLLLFLYPKMMSTE